MTRRILCLLCLVVVVTVNCREAHYLSFDPRPGHQNPPSDEQRLGALNHCTGAYTLGSLKDVDVCSTELKPGQSLVWNGTGWINKLPPRAATAPGTSSVRHTTCRRGQILLCHVTPSGSAIELCVSPSSVDTHLAHPHDKLGPCLEQHHWGTDEDKCPSKCDQSCPSRCDDHCPTRCDEMCPSACDDVCPSACTETIGRAGVNGPEGPQGAPGLACWDKNEDGICNLQEEDTNRDGVCSSLDCRGPQGHRCWDLNGDTECTFDPANDERNEDKNRDGMCTVADCRGWPGPEGSVGAPGPPGTQGLQGTHCWDLNGDNICAIPDEDTNGDGMCTSADCRVPSVSKAETFPGPSPGSPTVVSGTVSCDHGRTVTGGGCRPSHPGNPAVPSAFLVESAATSENGWTCSYAETSSSPENPLLSFVVEVHCV